MRLIDADALMETIVNRETTTTRGTEYLDGYAKCQHDILDIIEQLPSAQPEWNNHTVACLLAEIFGDNCACNFNGIDEWLPSKCELLDSCPNPVGVACWEQYLKHRTERRNDADE